MTNEEKEELIVRWRDIRSRGELKRIAKEIEASAEQESHLVSLLLQRDVEISKEWSIKKRLRIFLNRSEEAQVRKNPIHRNEAFTCIHCQKKIEKSRGKIRDHCPFCLRGLHLDNIPGDRASDCHGKLVPVEFILDHGEIIIRYQCERCTQRYQVKAHPDDQIPASLAIKDLP